jgi:hypothetical protein
MKAKKERMSILERLEKGEISPDEAAEALQRDPEEILKNLDSPMKILEAIEEGTISADEAAKELGKGSTEDEEYAFPPLPEMPEMPPQPLRDSNGLWEQEMGSFQIHSANRNLNLGFIWTAMIMLGSLFMVLSGLWMNSRINSPGGIDIWFFVAWLPFLIGLFLVAIGWSTLNSPFLKINIQSKRTNEHVKFQLGFPMPKRFFAWLLRNFGGRSSQFSHLDFDEILDKMERGISDEPILIHVDDENDNIDIQIG